MGKISRPVINSVHMDLLEFLRIRKTVFVWWVSKRTAGAGAWAGNNEQQTSSHRLGICEKPVLQCSHHLGLADFFAVGNFCLKLC